MPGGRTGRGIRLARHAKRRRAGLRFTPPDRRLLSIMVVSGVVHAFAAGLLTLTLPFWRVELGLSQNQASLVQAVVRVGTLVAIPLGIWGDRWGRRRPFLIALSVLLIASVATSVMPGVLSFTMLQTVARAAANAGASLAVVIIAEEIAAANRAYAMSFYVLAGSMGGGLALLLTPLFDSERGLTAWRWMFFATGLGSIILPLLRKHLRETRVFRRGHAQRFRTLVVGVGASRFWLLAAVGFVLGAFIAPATGFAYDHLVNDRRWDAGPATVVLVVSGAIGSLGLLAGGRLADRWGRRPVMGSAIVVGVTGAIGYYWLDWAPVAWLTIASLGSSLYLPAASAFRTELFSTAVRAAAGTALAAASVAGGISSLVAGYYTIERFGLPATVTGVGLLAVASVPLVWLLPETKGMQLSPPATVGS